jgi:hypothetical protein
VLLPETSRKPARLSRFLAKFRETTPDRLPSFARQNLETRSGAYVEYVSTPSAAKRSQMPRSAGVLAAETPAVVLDEDHRGASAGDSRLEARVGRDRNAAALLSIGLRSVRLCGSARPPFVDPPGIRPTILLERPDVHRMPGRRA